MQFIFILFIFTISLYSQENISIQYYEDNSSQLTINQLKSQNNIFKKLNTTKFGFKTSQFWLKITSTASHDKVLELLDPRLDRVYLYDENSTLLMKNGDKEKFSERLYNDSSVSFLLKAHKIYYIKISNKSKMNLEYKIWHNKTKYILHLEKKNLFKSFYFGAILIMLIYNMVIYLFLRERVFLEYVIYHSIFMYTMFYYTGIYGQFFFSEKHNLDYATVSIHLAAFSTIMAVQFFRSLLKTKLLTPKIDKILFYFILLHISLAIFDIFNIGYHINHIIFNVTMMLMSIFLLLLSLYIAYFKGNKTGYFYFFGWLIMMIGIILTSLTIMNIIPRNDFTSNIFQIGSLFEITLLSMALAYRYKLKQENIIQKNLIIQKQSKLASMGEMLQNISHQWRQPLSEINAVMMKIYADFYTKKLTATTLESDIEHIELVTQHMSETIEIFNNYFRKNNKKSFLSLEEIIYQAIRIIDGELKDVRVKIDIKENVKLMINSGHLIQVLHIIIINAVDAFYNTNSKYKKIYISLKTIDKKQIIEIEDNAGGIDTKIIEKIFEPYFTTKFQSNGIGIGLYMAKMLVEDSLSGNITVSNTKEGAKFKIEL